MDEQNGELEELMGEGIGESEMEELVDSINRQSNRWSKNFDERRFVLHTPQQSLAMLFSGLDNPHKVPHRLWGFGHPVIHGSFGLPESLSQMTSWSVQTFLQGFHDDNQET